LNTSVSAVECLHQPRAAARKTTDVTIGIVVAAAKVRGVLPCTAVDTWRSRSKKMKASPSVKRADCVVLFSVQTRKQNPTAANWIAIVTICTRRGKVIATCPNNRRKSTPLKGELVEC